jgi:hypothetical protein
MYQNAHFYSKAYHFILKSNGEVANCICTCTYVIVSVQLHSKVGI